ncbi:ATP-binding protein [Streptomyces sp. NPDC054796]
METDSPHTPAPAASPPTGPYTRSFAVQLSSTRRGARLARLFAVRQLAEWGVPGGSGLFEAVALVTAELAANAVRHCGGRGRDFRLRLLTGAGLGVGVRVEVTDACADRPLPPGPPRPSDDLTSGHGLLLVGALATRWGSTHDDLVTKTVWAELAPPGSPPRPS